MIDNINAAPDYGDEPPFACSTVAMVDGDAYACSGTPGHAGKHTFPVSRDNAAPETPADSFDSPAGRTYSAPESAAVTPGQAAYELWSEVMGTNGVTCEPYNALGNVEQMAWREVEARQPQPALATVDLHRWYAVISQPNGMTKVIGHTSDGLGYYDSVDEWEAKNS